MNWISSKLFFILILIFAVREVWAYPDNIGFGYRNCITCHYNGFGGGPINDYGRALFANTIASRALINDTYDDEKLTESSGFFMKPEAGPWWWKPGFKYRGLFLQTNPGSDLAVNRYIHMQTEFNSAFFFDQNENFIVVGSIGYLPPPTRLKDSGETISPFISREYYARYKLNEKWWVYAGFMDKVFGLRTNDHTAYNRAKVGVAQNDQTHGVVGHWINDKEEAGVHVFLGNMSQGSDLRQKGASLFYEKEVGEKRAAGASILTSKNNYVNWNRVSVHYKQGFGEGTSLIGEFGLLENTGLGSDTSKKLGSFLFTQSLIRLVRGYHLMMQFEHYNEEFSANSPDLYRLGLGFLTYPLPRFEFRLLAQSQRGVSQLDFVDDAWNLQGQLHVSW